MLNILIAVGAAGLSLMLAAHGLLLLRWCGEWSVDNRLLVLMMQMSFPWFAAPVLGAVGFYCASMIFGGMSTPSWVVKQAFAYAAAVSMATLIFCAPFLHAIGRPRHLCLSPLLAVPPTVIVLILVPQRASYGLPVLAATWSVFALGPSLYLAWRVRMSRFAKLESLCLDCDYDLTGLTSDRCPECGARVKRREPALASGT